MASQTDSDIGVMPTSSTVYDHIELATDTPQIPPCPVAWKHPFRFMGWLLTTTFGIASLIFFLAVISAVPILNFLALGYLLEVEGRIGRTGRIKEMFPLLHDAPRIGSIVFGVWIFLLPLRLLGSAAADAQLIDPGSSATFRLGIALNVVWFVITAHLILALARGGTVWCFVRPLKNLIWLVHRLREGDYLDTAGKHLAEFGRRLRVKHHFWLGLRGFAVAMIWLIIPTACYAAVQKPSGGQVLLTIFGGLLLVITLSWVPFLQARFATENRFASGFQLGEIRKLYRFAPVAWTIATIVVYLLALPLYLFKAFLLPPDAMWPITLIFIVSIYPTKVITGWAYHRAVQKRERGEMAHISSRWICNIILFLLLSIYVFILFFTQFLW